MSSIPVNKEGGMEPHLLKCARCKGDNGLSVGVLMQAEHKGQMVYCNRGQQRRIERQLDAKLTWSHVPEEQRYITMGVCTTCGEETKRFQEELNKGGIYFKCATCNTTGMIAGNAPLAKAVRKKMGIPAPGPCGMEFEMCSQHGDKDEKD